MQIHKFSIQTGKIPFLTIFFGGVLSGIFFVIVRESIFLKSTGILDEYTLYHMKYMSIDSVAFFYYILRKRIGKIAMFAILSTTYLGIFLGIGTVFWYGTSLGVFFTSAIMRYEIKGILLAFTGIFPQYLCYIPAFAGLVLWGEEVYRNIYFTSIRYSKENLYLAKRILQLGAIFFLAVIGCLLESFINLRIMEGLLKIF